ncbi:MAG: hypothetical protein ACO1QS_16415 [Verrucomicrobiota bacterium]
MRKFRLRWITFLSLAAMFWAPSWAGALERNYTKEAVLAEAEENQVIQLAAKHGISDVEKITTAHLVPSPYFFILVKERDTIEGRDVTYRLLSVKYKKWSASKDFPGKDGLRAGDFWAGPPLTRKLKILKVNGNEYRADVRHMTPEQCEQILGLLQQKKFLTEGSISKEYLERMDLERPNFFNYDETNKLYLMNFHDKRGGASDFTVEARFDGRELRIIKIQNVVA